MSNNVDYKFIDKHVQPWGGDPSTASKFFKQFKSIASKLGYIPFINGQVVIGIPANLLQASKTMTQGQLAQAKLQDDLNNAQVQHPHTPSQAQDAQEGEEKETQDQPASHSSDTTPAQAGSTHPTPPSSTIEFKQGVDVRKIIQDFDPTPPTSATTAAINPPRGIVSKDTAIPLQQPLLPPWSISTVPSATTQMVQPDPQPHHTGLTPPTTSPTSIFDYQPDMHMLCRCCPEACQIPNAQRNSTES